MSKLKFIKKLYKKEYYKWVIAVKKRSVEDFTIIESPANSYWADPFIIEQDEKIWIYFENFSFLKSKGDICVGEWDAKEKKMKNILNVFSDKSHYSFPSVYKYNNKYYLIPETHEKKRIDLFEIVELPNKVNFVKTLLSNIDSVDSILFYKDKYWYLFTNPKRPDNKTHLNNLEVYYSSSLLENEFSRIPIRERDYFNSSNSRMAGNIIINNNKFYRLSQNCSKIYGESIIKNEITKLSPLKYKEKNFGKLNKIVGYYANHTYNSSENYEVVDIMIKYNDFFGSLYYNFYRYTSIFRKIVKKYIKG